MATRAFGVRVTLGAIRAESAGAIPAFELRDIRLYDSAGRESLHLPLVRAALSVQSLWSAGFEQLVLEQPVLEVRRRADGHIEVAGIDVTAEPQQDSSALVDWVFSQAEVAIRQGELRWLDEMRPAAGPLVLQRLDLVLRNPGRQHQLRLDATPPPEWGQRFSLRAQMSQPLWQTDASQWRDWSGTLFADLPGIDLRHLRQHADLRAVLGLEVLQGQGALRCWADVRHGQLEGVTTDVALGTVAVRLGREREPLALNDLRARFEVHQGAADFSIASQGLAFHTADGLTWPGGNVRYGHTRGADGGVQRVSLQADRVDLLTVHQLASHLPLQAEVHHWFDTLQPRGLVQTLDLQWQAPAQATADLLAGRWQAKGQLQHFSLQAGPTPPPTVDAQGLPYYHYGRPGLSGADVGFELTQAGGQAELQLHDGALEFPGVFEEPLLPFSQLKTTLKWKTQGADIQLEIPELSFANADATGSLSGRWQTAPLDARGQGERYPGVLDINGSLSRADGTRVHRYLPVDIDAAARQYVRESVQRGQAQDVRFAVKGNLWDFPFERPGSGTFQVRAKLQGVDFVYAPPFLSPAGALPWPGLEQVQADFLIDRTSLLISKASGVVAGAPQLHASQAEARIDNFNAAQPMLKVQAQVSGPASDALSFVNRSPLLHMTGEALREARLSGPADVRFQLDLPLNKPEDTRVKGQVRFAGNDLRVTPDTPWLENATGVLSFTDKGFTLAPSTARLLGGELRFSGGMQEQRNGSTLIRFQGQGSITADGLRNARDWAAVSQLGQQATGGTPYQLKLEIGSSGLSLQVDSTLQGLGLNLPAPLAKPAGQAWPLRYAVQPVVPAKGVSATPALDRLSLDVGPASAPLFSALFERRHEPSGTRVLRGALALRGERPALPASGVQASLNLGDFDVDAWQRFMAAPAGASAGGSGDDSRPYWPTAFKLEASSLAHGGRSFHNVLAGGSRELDTWRLNVAAKELEGYLEYRPEVGAVPGRVYARLARLTVPPAQTAEVESLLQEQPAHVPALDIVVKDFELGGRSLGRLEVDAVNRALTQGSGDVVREWRLNKFNLTVPEARLEASGNWATLRGSSNRRTALNLRLSIDDSGALLERFGMPGVVRGGKGQIEGNLGWLGSPLALHVPSMGGQLKLNVERGQFLKADPGLAKLLGVLSLQALPRRLTLDFRDVFSDGFAFDFVRGDARIEQGVAHSNNLQMKGVNAAVLMEGSADLVRETQDLQVIVIPELNTGTAALVATAINPAVGLGSFLAQYLIGRPLLQAATTQRFHISGPWADPRVEKVAAPRNIDTSPGASPPASPPSQGAQP